MNGPIRRVAMAMLLGMVVLLGSATWYQVVGAERYRSHPQNPRTALTLAVRQRGLIVTANGTVLAESVSVTDHPREFQRRYPQGESFTPVVGYTSPLLGDFGLEEAYAGDLRSRRDPTISDLVAVVMGRDLRPSNLQVTIDHRLQLLAYQALAGNQGSVVALDPTTGAIRVLVSSPSVPTQNIIGITNPEPALQLPSVPQPPLDRATRWLYPPGSIFKTVTAAAALDTGTFLPETTLPNLVELTPDPTQPLNRIYNAGGGRCGTGEEVDIQTAYKFSCNIPFAQLASRVGAQRLEFTASNLGFGRTVPFPWSVATSQIGSPATDLEDPFQLALIGTGHGPTRVTPLSMAMLAALVANGGLPMQPYLVQQIFDGDGNITDTTSPTELTRAMSETTAGYLSSMMELVVTEGSGQQAAVAGLSVAGKTGTASNPDEPPSLWFIGFAPVDQPQIALAVVVEPAEISDQEPTESSIAATLAARILEGWDQLGPYT